MSNNKRMAALFISAMVTLAFSSTAFAQGMAMDKTASSQTAGQYTTKLIAEDAKSQVSDSVYRRGETAPIKSRLGQFSYTVRGGAFERTYADGSKEVVPRETGSTLLNSEKRPYSLKNIGKTTIE